MKLNANQRFALALIAGQESHGYNNGEAVCSTEESALIDGQAWIHFQTAQALERRGLVKLRDTGNPDEGAEIWLTPRGREELG